MRIRDFEFDPAVCELRCRGQNIRLERIPMELLALLIERRDQVVTRDEIVDRVWGKNVFLDVDNSINTAVRKLRSAFGDDPERPTFIKTLTGKGYRFIAPVDAGPGEKSPDVETVSKRRAMIAVLPFENMSADPDQEYFVDGLTEETISHLGQMDPERIGVIARTSSMSYKRTTKSVSRIGNELLVDYVLESGVRRQGNHVRITSQLIRVSDQTHLWTESFDRDATQFLGVQDEIGNAIAQKVGMRLVPGSGRTTRSRTHDAAAYEFYLRGRYYWNQLTPTGINRAIEFFARAAALDPDYALAYAALAECYAILPISCDASVLDILPKALAASARALELDDSLAEAHASLGAIKAWMEWDWKGAEKSILRAIELNQSYVHAHRWYAVVLSATGRHSDSAAEMTKAREVDPLSPLMHGLSGILLYNAGEDDRAIKHLENALALNPQLWVLHLWIAKPYERKGMLALAIDEYQKALDLSGGNTEALSLKAYLQAQTGNTAGAHQAIQFLIELSAQRHVPSYNIAIIFAGLGDDESALSWLERAYVSRDARLTWLAVEPKWNLLRPHTRFQDLLRRMSLPRVVISPPIDC